nr:MAG TPA: hypothetical protein [Caudoviricetes sp.]DAN98630.1 MAG TPA: hypothetical protein [Caudoviricetes sp.]
MREGYLPSKYDTPQTFVGINPTPEAITAS